MSEKKWFIYVQDHHEGPFTVEEIWTGIDAGRFSKTGFVWSDGMKDWIALATIPDFERSAPPIPEMPGSASNGQVESPTGITDIGMRLNVEATEPSFVAGPVAEPIDEPTLTSTKREMTVETAVDSKTSIIEIASLESATHPQMLRPAVLGSSAATRPSTQGPGEKKPIITRRMKPFLYAVVAVFILLGFQKSGVLHPLEDRIASLLSTLPELSDVTPEDYQELKKAAKAPSSAGPQVAVALSKSDPLSPIFYVATNLPDGARFEIYVEGVPHRLLNTLSYSGKLDVATTKRLAKSVPLRYPDGKPIPRGEYLVYVMESPIGQPDLVYKELLPLAPVARNLPNQLPQDRRLVFSKKIFFGAKDATYEQRLKEFHDGLVARAKNEATELSLAAATLESQALVSESAYDRLKRQPIGPKQKQVWNEMNRTWRPVEAQLVQKYAGLSPDQIKDGFFHGNLVAEFLVVEKILADLHSAQEKLFTTTASYGSLEGQVMSLRNQFEMRKSAWKTAIDKARAMPANPETGLPVAVTIEGAAAPEKGRGKGNG